MELESKETARFLTFDSEDKPYTIIEFTDYWHDASISGSEKIKGLRQYKTDKGLEVNRISEAEFEIIGSGTIRVHFPVDKTT
jgi:hypothetical protein